MRHANPRIPEAQEKRGSPGEQFISLFTIHLENKTSVHYIISDNPITLVVYFDHTSRLT